MFWFNLVIGVLALAVAVWQWRAVATFLSIFLPNLLRRLPLSIATLWFVATLVFTLMKLAGDAAIFGEGRIDPTVRANLIKQYYLDRPVYEQYWRNISKLAQLDSLPSRSVRPGTTYRDVLRNQFPFSAALGLRAIALAIVMGVPVGIVCALYHGRWQDQLGTVLALAGVSVPSFILATVILYVLARELKWFPATAWHQDPWRLWIPAMCLGAFPFAAILRLTRASMLEALREDYVRTARAKGLSPLAVIGKHALRNALGAVVTYIGPVTAGVLTGSLVVEQIFAIPGMGDMFVRSITNRDMPLILGATVFYSFVLVSMNLIVDSLYPILNPRLRSG